MYFMNYNLFLSAVDSGIFLNSNKRMYKMINLGLQGERYSMTSYFHILIETLYPCLLSMSQKVYVDAV